MAGWHWVTTAAAGMLAVWLLAVPARGEERPLPLVEREVPAQEVPAQGGEGEGAMDGSCWGVLERDGRFGRFLVLAQEAGLDLVLRGGHAVTVVAPTDAAFEALPAEALTALMALGGRGEEGRARLREIIGAHLIWGRLESPQVQGLMLRPTLGNRGVTLRSPDVAGVLGMGGMGEVGGAASAPPACASCVGCDGGADGHAADPALFFANDVPVMASLADWRAGNGVVHGVSSLLLDPAQVSAAGPLRHAPECENNPHRPGGSGIGLGGLGGDRSTARSGRTGGGSGGMTEAGIAAAAERIGATERGSSAGPSRGPTGGGGDDGASGGGSGSGPRAPPSRPRGCCGGG